MHPDNRWNPFGVRMINAVFDVFFFFDLIVVFRTGIVERRKDNDERYVNFVTSNVMKRYLCGWFFVDLVATIPWKDVCALAYRAWRHIRWFWLSTGRCVSQFNWIELSMQHLWPSRPGSAATDRLLSRAQRCSTWHLQQGVHINESMHIRQSHHRHFHTRTHTHAHALTHTFFVLLLGRGTTHECAPRAHHWVGLYHMDTYHMSSTSSSNSSSNKRRCQVPGCCVFRRGQLS